MADVLPKNVERVHSLLGANGLPNLIVGDFAILNDALVSGSIIVFGIANACAGALGLMLQQGIAVDRSLV